MIASVTNRSNRSRTELEFSTGIRERRAHWPQVRIDLVGPEARNSVILVGGLPEVTSWKVRATETENIKGVQGPIYRLPDIAAKGAAGQFVLDPVEEESVAAV